MALTPWYKVATPREDLRLGKPLDASEFAIHLDQVLDGRAPLDYREPQRLFSKTYITSGLLELLSEVVRRLSGEMVGASAVVTLTTQFGGGKTHALALLYHLARHGPEAKEFPGVEKILGKANVTDIPKAAVAVFVGTAFDFISGRGSKGEPVRKTPWGEIAWQLGGLDSFKVVEEHDSLKIAPAKDVIHKFLPQSKPVLILMDEVLNFMGRARSWRPKNGSNLSSEFYRFLQNLSEEAMGSSGVCLVLSLPKSEREMTPEDHDDFGRLQKLATRGGKPYILSEGLEIAEIIRRRLFDDLGPEKEREEIAKAYAEWVIAHRDKLPKWFPIDHAKEIFEATFPFHPVSLSVFERKWQTLPQFQRTRGVLRMFALWVSRAYREGYSGAHKDSLISLGSAPFEDSLFRAEVFNQLGENLEAAVTADIAGEEAHATRLDSESINTIKSGRLHRKVAASIFFESSGGQVREYATEPEVRLAVGEPGIDIGNIETVLDALSNECYHLTGEGRRYWISSSPNLNKLLADRRANIPEQKIKETVEKEVRDVFAAGTGIECIFFPEDSRQIPDVPSLTLVILHPEHSWAEQARSNTEKLIDTMTREHGESGRTFKSALIWVATDGPGALNEEARRLLAWQVLEEELESLNLSDSQHKYLTEQLKRSQRDLKEAVWRSYRNVLLLGKDNKWKRVDLGLVHSSAAESMVRLILTRLKQEGDLEEEGVSPSFLARNWPPALREWSTKTARDAFYASPQFPRLTRPENLKRTIVEGVSRKPPLFGYVEKAPDGSYVNLHFGDELSEDMVKISDDVYLIPKDLAESIKAGVEAQPDKTIIRGTREAEGQEVVPSAPRTSVVPTAKVGRLSWEGDLPPQKWMTFYTKVLSRFHEGETLKLKVKVEAQSEEGISKPKIEETKAALKELGLSNEVKAEEEQAK